MPVTVPVDYETNPSGLERDLTRDVTKAGSKAGKGFGSSFSSSARRAVGGLAAIGAAVGVKDFLSDSLDEAREAQKVGALTAQVIKTTGSAANVTADQVGELSTAISNRVGVDDEAIQSGANLLLTFKNVRNEVGKGNAVFDRATQAAVDLSASGFGDLAGTSKQLGKALNDPIKGISALGRAGVTFTEDQKATIKSLVEQNDILGAQKIILKEVESQVGGSAAAQVTASDKARVAFGNLKEEIGTALLPVVDDLANKVTKDVIPAVSELIQEFQDGTGTGGEIRDVLEDVGGALQDVAEFGKGVFDLFNSLPGPVKSTVIQLGLAYGALRLIQGVTGPTITGLSGVVTQFRNVETRAAATKTAANNLGGGLRNAAGAAGMIGLAAASQQTSKELGFLAGAAGGAATGFAIGGPWGAAIGGAAGGLLGIATSGKDAASGVDAAGEAARINQPSIDALRQTVDDTTGAFTRLTAVEVGRQLFDQASIAGAAKLGLNFDQLTRAATGSERAQGKVEDRLNSIISAAEGFKNIPGVGIFDKNDVKLTFDQAKAMTEAANIAKTLQGRIGQLANNNRAAATAAVAQSLATGELDKALQGIPDRKVLEISDAGSIAEAREKIARLKADGIDVTRNQYKLLMEIAGLPRTKKDLDRLERDANRVARDRAFTITAFAGRKLFLKDVLGSDLFNRLPGLGNPSTGSPAPAAPSNGRVASPSRTALASPTDPSARIVINQNNYGPQTSRGKQADIEWNLRYATRARTGV